MGFFDQLAGVDLRGKSMFFQPGDYAVEISAIRFLEGRNGDKIIIECIVLGAVSDSDRAPQPGQKAAQFITADNKGTKGEMGMRDWKTFLVTAYGLQDEYQNYTDEQWLQLSNAVFDGSLVGQRYELSAWHTDTKAGGVFTVHDWIGPLTQESMIRFGVA